MMTKNLGTGRGASRRLLGNNWRKRDAAAHAAPKPRWVKREQTSYTKGCTPWDCYAGSTLVGTISPMGGGYYSARVADGTFNGHTFEGVVLDAWLTRAQARKMIETIAKGEERTA